MGLKIRGIGTYLPKHRMTSEEHDVYRGWKKGTSYKNSKIQTYYLADYKNDETVVKMATYAIRDACQKGNIDVSEIDLIIKASATDEQPLPCTASLIQKELGLGKSGIPAFDIDSTCLSFIVAMNIANLMLEAGQYERICIVSSEIPSVATNNNQPSSAALFNDGAVCYLFEKGSKAFHYALKTYGVGANSTQIRGGGTTLPVNEYTIENDALYRFDMNGLEVFKLSDRYIREITTQLITAANKESLNDFDVIIPHQASYGALRTMERSLKLKRGQMYNVIERYGNMVASSIPMTLQDAIQTGRVAHGDHVFLIGTSAGLSIGGIVLEIDIA